MSGVLVNFIMLSPPAQTKSPPAELQSPPIENFLPTVLLTLKNKIHVVSDMYNLDILEFCIKLNKFPHQRRMFCILFLSVATFQFYFYLPTTCSKHFFVFTDKFQISFAGWRSTRTQRHWSNHESWKDVTSFDWFGQIEHGSQRNSQRPMRHH